MVNLAILCVYALSIFSVISIPWTQVSCGARSQTFLLSVLLYCPLLIIIFFFFFFLSRALFSVSSSQGWSCLRCPIDPRQTCRSWSRIDLGTGVHRELFPCTVQMAANAQWLILNGGSQSSRVTSVRQAERCVPSCWCTIVRGLVRERTVLILLDQNAAVKTRLSWSPITRDLPFFTGKIFLHDLWEEKVPKMMDSRV